MENFRQNLTKQDRDTLAFSISNYKEPLKNMWHLLATSLFH